MAGLGARLAEGRERFLPELAQLPLGEANRVGAHEPDDALVLGRAVRVEFVQADAAAAELGGQLTPPLGAAGGTTGSITI